MVASSGGTRWFKVALRTCLGQLGAFSACPSSSRRLAQTHSHGGREVPSHRRGQTPMCVCFPSLCLHHIFKYPTGQSKSHGQAGSRGVEMDSTPGWGNSKVMWPSAVRTGTVGILQPPYSLSQAAPSWSAGEINPMSSSF